MSLSDNNINLKILILLGAVTMGLSLLFFVRAVRQRGNGRYWWVLGALFGLGCFGFITASGFIPEPPRGQFDLRLEIIQIVGLSCGVILTIFAALYFLPLILGRLERGRFVGFVSARMLSGSKSGFLTVISVLSILGVSVSSCALCSVTSIMGGFGYDLKRKILDNTAHMIVDVTHPNGFSADSNVLEAVRAELPKGAAATAVVGGDAMASSATNTAGTLVRGVDAETIGQVISIEKNIDVGAFKFLVKPKLLTELPADAVIGRGIDGEPITKGPGFLIPGEIGSGIRRRQGTKVLPGVILGRELAKSLHVYVGDELTMLSPRGELGPAGIMPRSRKFRVAAIFYSGMYEYDASHAYILTKHAQDLFDLKGRYTNIDARIDEPENVTTARIAVDRAVAAINVKAEKAWDTSKGEFRPYRVRDWKMMNKNLFSALKLEKIATFIILSLAIAVASFCIICTLLLMVTEKSRDIAVLKALGAADNEILKVFMVEGILIGAIGTIIGVGVALAACLGLSWTGVRLDPDVYYIDRLPVNVDLVDYAVVAVAAMVICTLATIYPALTASRVRPVDGLRYE